MTTYFITRHAGAKAWAAAQGMTVDAVLAHLDVDAITAGDVVIGTLPVHLAAEVCERGARYFHLSMDLPAEMRGRELTAEDMAACDARLEEFLVEEVE